MICVDNSEWMRNGDYSPSRFQAQADAVNLLCGAKTQVISLSFFAFGFCSISLVLIFWRNCSRIQRIQWGY